MATAGRKFGQKHTIAEDAKRMQYNPLAQERTDKPLWTVHPELAEVVVDYVKGKTTDKFKIRAINYMVWLYSSDSVLNTKPVDPLKDRKYKSLDLAGFKMDASGNDYPEKVVDELINLGDPKFVNMVLAYILHQKNELWGEIVVSSEQHFEAMRLRMTPVSGKDSKNTMDAAEMKKKLRIECKELMMDIKQYWDEFWEDHVDLKAVGHAKMYKSIEDRARINIGKE